MNYTINIHNHAVIFIYIKLTRGEFVFVYFKSQKWFNNPGIYFIQGVQFKTHMMAGDFIRKYVKNGCEKGTMLRTEFKKLIDLENFIKDLSPDETAAEIQIMLKCLIHG